MPNRDQLAATVARELRAASTAQRRPGAAARFAPLRGAQSETPRGRWLYPLSGRRETKCDVPKLTSGDRQPAALASFARAIRSKRAAHDPWWALTTNFPWIRAGDFVYFYAADEDAGIIGFARVEATGTPAPGGPQVKLRLDVALSTKLMEERPVSASMIGRWLRPPKAAVEDLSAVGEDLDRMLSSFSGYAKHLRELRRKR